MRITACLALVSALGIGCQTGAPSRFDRIAVDDPRADSLLRAQTQRADSRRALRAAIHLSLDAKDLQFRRPERIAVQRPAYLRIEVLALFGQIAAVLVSDGTQFQRLSARSGEFDSGEVTEDLLWNVARIRLTPREAVDLILGAPVPSDDFERHAVWALGGGGIAIDFGSGRLDRNAFHRSPARERFEFDGAGDLRGLRHWNEAGVMVWQADFDDYRDVSGTPFAFDVTLEFPGVGARARLRFDDVAFESELADELFILRGDPRDEVHGGAELRLQ